MKNSTDCNSIQTFRLFLSSDQNALFISMNNSSRLMGGGRKMCPRCPNNMEQKKYAYTQTLLYWLFQVIYKKLLLFRISTSYVVKIGKMFDFVTMSVAINISMRACVDMTDFSICDGIIWSTDKYDDIFSTNVFMCI